jgi:hypothetical protein
MNITPIKAYRRKIKINDNDVFALFALERNGGEVHGALGAGRLTHRPGTSKRSDRENNLAGGLAMSRLVSLGMVEERIVATESGSVTVYCLNDTGRKFVAQAEPPLSIQRPPHIGSTLRGVEASRQ